MLDKGNNWFVYRSKSYSGRDFLISIQSHTSVHVAMFDLDSRDICEGAENLPVYFVSEGIRQKLDIKGVISGLGSNRTIRFAIDSAIRKH